MILKISFVFFLAIGLNANASGTSIGNGGDPVFYFLKSIRDSLRQTIDYLSDTPNDAKNICADIKSLSVNQRKDCSNFAL